jgi:hypothetical protein
VCVGYIGCNTDADCLQGTPRCDPEKGRCTECLEHADCAEEEYCREGFENECVPDECVPGEQICAGNEIVVCSEVGDRWILVEECNEEEECVGDPPHCEEIPVDPTDDYPGTSDSTDPPDDSESPDDDPPDDDTGQPEGPTGGGATGDSTESTRSCACRSQRRQALPWLLFAGAILLRRRRG